MEQDTDVSRALRDAVGSVLDEVRKAPPMQQIVSQPAAPAPQPAPPWHVWICATAAIVSAMVAGGAVLFAMDARTEMRANNVNRENDIRELRQADSAFRAYINTGRVPVQPQQRK